MADNTSDEYRQTTISARIKAQLAYKNIEHKYRFDGEIAGGGMGVIYKVFDKELHRNLAMKVLKAKHNLPAEEMEVISQLFCEEAQITAQLEHPNIVPVHDIGVLADGNIYFTMKIVAGEALSVILKRLQREDPQYRQKYTLTKLLIIFRKVCDAVAFAHSRNVIHRDIKPDNIMIGCYGEVILMDWGIGKFMGTKNLSPDEARANIYSLRTCKDFHNTETGTIMGTPFYMSPEQVLGNNESIDKFSDIYLLGATLYQILTLVPPHTGSDRKTLFTNIVQGKLIHPQERSPAQQIAKELCRITMKAMARDKQDRYQSIQELCHDIDAFLQGDIMSMPLQFRRGEFLIHQGKIGTEGYVLLKGKVEVFQNIGNKKILLTTLQPGDIVGEMAIISSDKRTADVVASEDTEVLVINEEQIREVLKRVPPWLEKVLSKLVERLKIANGKIHPLMISDPVYHILHQLAALCALQVYRKQAPTIEELQICLRETAEEIAVTLCIPPKKVCAVLEKLLHTELCEKLANGKFRICDFVLFGHVVDFLREVFELETSPMAQATQSLSKQDKIRRCKIAAAISQQAKEFLSNIPFYAEFLE